MAESSNTAAATQRAVVPAKRITNDTPIPSGDVIGVKVGSEAAQEGSDVGPVEGVTGDLSASTHVKNTTLRERDRKEMEKRGGGPRSFQASASFEGMKMVDNGLSDPFPVSGSYSGPVGEDGLKIRNLTPEEEKKFTAGGQAANRRADDEVRGSGMVRGSGASGGTSTRKP